MLFISFLCPVKIIFGLSLYFSNSFIVSLSLSLCATSPIISSFTFASSLKFILLKAFNKSITPFSLTNLPTKVIILSFFSKLNSLYSSSILSLSIFIGLKLPCVSTPLLIVNILFLSIKLFSKAVFLSSSLWEKIKSVKYLARYFSIFRIVLYLARDIPS
ncbi:hypothetical protein ES708_07304 [subsurface metagenome]